MAGEIRVVFTDLEGVISQIKSQYDSLTDIESSLERISFYVRENWEDPSQIEFDNAFQKMREVTLPQAMVLLDTVQTLFETVISTYREADAEIGAMIG